MIAPRCVRLIAVVLALASSAIHPAAANARPLAPGAPMSAPNACTLGFVFTDGDRLYLSTAAHCTTATGNRVEAPGVGPFGSVVLRRSEDDIAFIRVDQDKEHLVEPVVQGRGAPTGVAISGQTGLGDELVLTGQGIGVSTMAETRSRPGVLITQDERRFTADAPAIFGDSGGPVIHVPTGRALGSIEGIAATVPPTTVFGTTVERSLVVAQNAGLPLSLVTG